MIHHSSRVNSLFTSYVLHSREHTWCKTTISNYILNIDKQKHLVLKSKERFNLFQRLCLDVDILIGQNFFSFFVSSDKLELFCYGRYIFSRYIRFNTKLFCAQTIKKQLNWKVFSRNLLKYYIRKYYIDWY